MYALHPQRIAFALLPWFLLVAVASAQPRPAAPAASTVPVHPTAPAHPNAPAAVASEKDLAATQSELMRLLRLSPTLTTVLEHDPTLLANPDYVRKNNPQLAAYLEAHPEIALNPDFYLFSHLKQDDRDPGDALHRAVWPELVQPRYAPSVADQMAGAVGPLFVVLCLLGTGLWLVRLFVENRRWNRIFKLQMEVHSKLIDKFGTSQELVAYMETEAGKRFLEAAPIPIHFEQEERIPGPLSRVLAPFQTGAVLMLLGAGLLMLRGAHPGLHLAMQVLGTAAFTAGIGFLLSALVAWVLLGRPGLPTQGTKAVRSADGQ